MTTLGSYMPAAMAELEFDLHVSDYSNAVAAAGGLPVQLTRDADVSDIVRRLDGLVLSGGADIDPARYGATPDEHLGSVEPERDEWEFALYATARAIDLPVLGICRGFQLINVAQGGTLHQHVELDGGAGHPQWDVDGRFRTHRVVCVANTLPATLLGDEFGVNSLHHQTLDQVGEGIEVGARATDGVVEAYTIPGAPVLAVQWHPELLPAPDPTFGWLVGAASSFAARRSERHSE